MQQLSRKNIEKKMNSVKGKLMELNDMWMDLGAVG